MDMQTFVMVRKSQTHKFLAHFAITNPENLYCEQVRKWQTQQTEFRIESKFSSAICFTTKLQKCSSIFVLRNGIPRVFCSEKQPDFHRNKPFVPFVSSTPPAFRRIILFSEILNPSFAFFSFHFNI